MTKKNLFLNTKTHSKLWTSSSLANSCSEIDLREEFDKLIFASDGCIRHGQLLVIRHMRRDENGNKIPCTCLDQFSKEPAPDCSYCLGEGYLWDEKWYIGRAEYLGSDGGLANRYRFTPPGEIRADLKVFFFRYDTPIRYGDKIVEMLLDEEGNPVIPYVRAAIYKPQTVRKYRSDYGRIEYIAAYCLEKDAIRQDY